MFADPVTQTSRPVPQALRDILAGYEAGESMVRLQTGSWAELGPAASAVRTTVFVHEQKVPLDMEWDAADATAVHTVAFNRLGQPLATGRLLPSDKGVARIGRMAVERVVRGTNMGRSILEALADAARARGDKAVL